MGSRSLPPLVILMAYATTDELKAWLGLDRDDDTADTLLELSLDTASSDVNEHCHRDFTAATSATSGERSFRVHAGRWVFVDDCTEVYSVTIDGVSYTVETEPVTEGRPHTTLREVDGGLFPEGTATVSAKWGWPAVPARVKQATLILAAKRDARRNSPNGIEAGNDAMGFVRILGVDKDVESLLSPLVRVARTFA